MIENGRVSFWWRQIGYPDGRPPLDGDADVDVAIVGAGYTGLWTAYALAEADPSLRILVIEQAFAGFGASGRNGGWLANTITGGRDGYAREAGRDAVVRFQRAMNDTVDEVIRVADAEGIDADIVKGGELIIARNAPQRARLQSFFESESAWPGADWELLDTAGVRDRIAIDGAEAGMWQPHCARIHPAKLAAGLADAVERKGVRIVERTRASELLPGKVLTNRGTVTARFVVRATEGFTSQLEGERRTWLPMNSSMIVTEPLPDDFWDAVGWQGREVFSDTAHVYVYVQRTADGRIALGGRGMPYRWGSAVDASGETSRHTIRELKGILADMFPGAAYAAIDHAWSGVLGVPRDWRATVGLDRRTGIAWAGGYVGTGVASTNLAGRTLADLILERDTDLVDLPWVNQRVRKWEPEPLRWLAVHGLYRAYHVADDAEVRRTSTSPIATIADRITGKH